MPHHLPLRLTALAVSIAVALASGTPYLYGVFAPQLVKRVGLTASDSASISMASNIGSGFGGLPAGLMIDHWGPARSIMIGALSVFCGYFALNRIYEYRVESLLLICLAMVFVGFGSVLCFFSTLKAAQANFPQHRGTASAFPVSAYGLSATVFSAVAAMAYSDDTAGLLKFLSIFCGAVTFMGSFFVNIHDDKIRDHDIEGHGDQNRKIQRDEENQKSQKNQKDNENSKDLDHQKYDDSSDGYGSVRTGSCSNDDLSPKSLPQTMSRNPSEFSLDAPKTPSSGSLRGSFSFWGVGRRTPRNSFSNGANPMARDGSPRAAKPEQSPLQSIRSRLTSREFLTHYLVTALAGGIGQMYIYTVGFVVIAQYNYGKDSDSAISSTPPVSGGAASLQALQVSLISIASFSGRLMSGFASDFIHKSLRASRLWIVVFVAVALAGGQYITIHNVGSHTWVSVASVVIGWCYGLVYGTYPAIIADSFGTRTFSTSWGLICTGPLVVLFNLNRYFGIIYDRNTDDKTGVCYKGNMCYKQAFEVSFGLCFVVLGVTLLLIKQQRKRNQENAT